MAYAAIGAVISILVFGFICKAITSSRGMEGGFWWGLLGIIGVIIVAVRPNENIPTKTKSSSSAYDDLERIAKLKEQGLLSEEEYAKMKSDCLERMK